MKKERRKDSKCTLSQHELNVLHEGPVLDMAQRYANIMLLFMLTAFYTPLIPITPLVTGLGALMQYWIEKFMLLRVHSRPETMSSFMPNLVAKVFPSCVVLYGISNYIFLRQLKGENTIGLASLIFSAAFLLFPTKFIIKK